MIREPYYEFEYDPDNPLAVLLREHGRRHHHPPQETIFEIADESDKVYLVEKGMIECRAVYDNGKEIIQSIHGPGDMFGYPGVIDSQSRVCGAYTCEDTTLIHVEGDVFMKLLFENAELNKFVVMHLAYHMRRLSIRLSNNVCLRPRDLVIRDLLQRYIDRPYDGPIKMPPRKLWALYLGMTRETLSRVMSDLLAEGLVSVANKNDIILEDFDGLCESSEQDSSYFLGA